MKFIGGQLGSVLPILNNCNIPYSYLVFTTKSDYRILHVYTTPVSQNTHGHARQFAGQNNRQIVVYTDLFSVVVRGRWRVGVRSNVMKLSLNLGLHRANVCSYVDHR